MLKSEIAAVALFVFTPEPDVWGELGSGGGFHSEITSFTLYILQYSWSRWRNHRGVSLKWLQPIPCYPSISSSDAIWTLAGLCTERTMPQHWVSEPVRCVGCITELSSSAAERSEFVRFLAAVVKVSGWGWSRSLSQTKLLYCLLRMIRIIQPILLHNNSRLAFVFQHSSQVWTFITVTIWLIKTYLWSHSWRFWDQATRGEI